MNRRIKKKHSNYLNPRCRYCKKIIDPFKFIQEVFPHPFENDVYIWRGLFTCKKCKRKNYIYGKTFAFEGGYEKLLEKIKERENAREKV